MGRGRRCNSPSPHPPCWGWMSSRLSWPGTARSPRRWPGASRQMTPARGGDCSPTTTAGCWTTAARTYRPPARLAAFIIARDQTCTFASCTRPAVACDLDHLTAAKRRRTHLRRQPAPAVPAASPLQTPHALATATTTRRIHPLDQPHRPHLPHQTPATTDHHRARDSRPARSAPAARRLEPALVRRPGPATVLTGTAHKPFIWTTCSASATSRRRCASVVNGPTSRSNLPMR